MSAREYRVVWKREGALGAATAIHQTREAAVAKAERERAGVDSKGIPYVSLDGDGVGVPPLEYLRIESREVGPWVADGDSEPEWQP